MLEDEEPKQALGLKFLEHKIFGDLERYVEFYESLSMSVFGFSTVGTAAICNIDSYVYSSMQSTLDSIRRLLQLGRINDGYYLLRKFHDASIINIYTNLYLSRNVKIDQLIVSKINNWLRGTEKLPRFGEMAEYLRKADELKDLNALLFRDSDTRYNELRKRCNDHAHHNFYETVLLNDGNLHVRSRIGWLEQMREDILDAFIQHISYIFWINQHYMTSSDYVDALEMGMVPEENSQYWVAPYIQSIFQEVLNVHRPDIAELIKAHSSMNLE